jgi:hypothetical protein
MASEARQGLRKNQLVKLTVPTLNNQAGSLKFAMPALAKVGPAMSAKDKFPADSFDHRTVLSYPLRYAAHENSKFYTCMPVSVLD